MLLSLGPYCLSVSPPKIRHNHVHCLSSMCVRVLSLHAAVIWTIDWGFQHVVFPSLAQSSNGHVCHVTHQASCSYITASIPAHCPQPLPELLTVLGPFLL